MIAATGELVAEHDFPEIYVWNIETKDILARLKGFHTHAVKYVFSFFLAQLMFYILQYQTSFFLNLYMGKKYYKQSVSA